jgi:hypothetical protein
MNHKKSFRDIFIREKKTTLNSVPREVISISEMSLSEKIDEYILKLGYSNAHVLVFLMQLLVEGKVSVDFRAYSERLELLDSSDEMNRAEVAALFDEHMHASDVARDGGGISGPTQRILIQMPKINLPH